MFSKRIALACLAGTIALSPVNRVAADGGDVVGGIIGGVIGGVIVNEANRNRERRRTVTVPRATSATRAMNRETQVSLNYFGFPAGTPDGILGRNSRNAISQYQAYMGYPVTGHLTEYERQFLVGSYHRAQAGGATTVQLVSQTGEGTRGLLKIYRDEAMGAAPLASAGTGGKQLPAATETATLDASKPAAETDGAALPSFMGAEGESASLASHCNRVSLLTSSNGGFVTEAAMSDPGFALNEQFCLARTYAIAEGESIATRLQGVTSAQVEEQCQAFGPAMQTHVAALALKPQEEVIQDVSGFILSTGMTPAQLSGTAKVCLSVGYRTDDMGVAVGSALLLTALGEPVYAELLGHHLGQGFGTPARPDLALAWYEVAFDALDNGAEPVFAPGVQGRQSLIRSAAYQVGGHSDGAAGMAETPASTLPSFDVDQ